MYTSPNRIAKRRTLSERSRNEDAFDAHGIDLDRRADDLFSQHLDSRADDCNHSRICVVIRLPDLAKTLGVLKSRSSLGGKKKDDLEKFLTFKTFGNKLQVYGTGKKFG